jgi:hypothetical protein
MFVYEIDSSLCSLLNRVISCDVTVDSYGKYGNSKDSEGDVRVTSNSIKNFE